MILLRKCVTFSWLYIVGKPCNLQFCPARHTFMSTGRHGLLSLNYKSRRGWNQTMSTLSWHRTLQETTVCWVLAYLKEICRLHFCWLIEGCSSTLITLTQWPYKIGKYPEVFRYCIGKNTIFWIHKLHIIHVTYYMDI